MLPELTANIWGGIEKQGESGTEGASVRNRAFNKANSTRLPPSHTIFWQLLLHFAGVLQFPTGNMNTNAKFSK